MYTFESRVRYSEADEFGRLSLTSIINYFQDCSTFQSEEVGLGLSYLKEHQRAWWLNSWQILIDRQPVFGEPIRISTWSHGFKGIFGFRNFTIGDEAGNLLVRADSNWFYYDLEHGCPTRVTREEGEGYGTEPALPMPSVSRKIVIPEGTEEREPMTVQQHHLDTNRHVNNAQYVAMAAELLPEDFTVRGLRAEYKKAAYLGDILYPAVAMRPEGCYIALRDQEGSSYVNLQLTGKREDE